MISPLNPTYCVIPQHGQQSVSNLIGRCFTIVNYVAGIVLTDEIPIGTTTAQFWPIFDHKFSHKLDPWS